jgi:hypothetical protein
MAGRGEICFVELLQPVLPLQAKTRPGGRSIFRAFRNITKNLVFCPTPSRKGIPAPQIATFSAAWADRRPCIRIVEAYLIGCQAGKSVSSALTATGDRRESDGPLA